MIDITAELIAQGSALEGARRRQRSEQYFTSDQLRRHFLRQAKASPQLTQIFVGR